MGLVSNTEVTLFSGDNSDVSMGTALVGPVFSAGGKGLASSVGGGGGMSPGRGGAAGGGGGGGPSSSSGGCGALGESSRVGESGL